MSEYITVAQVGAIAEGQGETFKVGNRLVAVFCERGKYYAIDDLCPHMGASLSAGELHNGTVACPWHAWRFCIREGTWCDNPKIKTDRFEVRVLGTAIQVKVEQHDEQPHDADGN